MKAMRQIPKVYDQRINIEVRKAVWEEFERRFTDMDTVILWILHSQFGFGEKRLRKYFDSYRTEVKKLQSAYGDEVYTKMREALMHDVGVDVKAWEKEV